MLLDLCIGISAVKRLIVINHIQNKSFCLLNIYVCTVYIFIMNEWMNERGIYIMHKVYKYTHIQYIFWKYLHVFTCIYLYSLNEYYI